MLRVTERGRKRPALHVCVHPGADRRKPRRAVLDIHIYDAMNHGCWLCVDRDRELREAPAQNACERLLRFLGWVLS